MRFRIPLAFNVRVPRAPRGEDGSPNGDHEQRREGKVQERCRPVPRFSVHWKSEEHPGCCPDDGQSCQRGTDERFETSPIARRCEQEASDHRESEAEHHLMRVPVHRRKQANASANSRDFI